MRQDCVAVYYASCLSTGVTSLLRGARLLLRSGAGYSRCNLQLGGNELQPVAKVAQRFWLTFRSVAVDCMRMFVQYATELGKVALLGSSAGALQVVKLLKTLSNGYCTLVALTVAICMEIAITWATSGHDLFML